MDIYVYIWHANSKPRWKTELISGSFFSRNIHCFCFSSSLAKHRDTVRIEHSGAWRKNTHAQHLCHPFENLAQSCIRFAYDYGNTLCELQFKYLSFPLGDGDNAARTHFFFPPSTFFVRIRRRLIRAVAAAIPWSHAPSESENEMHQKME